MTFDRQLCIAVLCEILLSYHQLCAQEKSPAGPNELYTGYSFLSCSFNAYVCCSAKNSPTSPKADQTPHRFTELPRLDVFTGYSLFVRDYTHTQLNPASGPMHGWDIALDIPSTMSGRRFGFTVDVSGQYRVSGFFTPQLYHVMAGPQVSGTVGRSRTFAHGLIGILAASSDVIAQTRSHVILAAGAGAGIDVPVASRIGWRFNLDWVYGGFESNDTNHITEIVKNNARFSTGPVFRF